MVFVSFFYFNNIYIVNYCFPELLRLVIFFINSLTVAVLFIGNAVTPLWAPFWAPLMSWLTLFLVVWNFKVLKIRNTQKDYTFPHSSHLDTVDNHLHSCFWFVLPIFLYVYFLISLHFLWKITPCRLSFVLSFLYLAIYPRRHSVSVHSDCPYSSYGCLLHCVEML